ncbi:MAG: amidohydrolase family protein [Candidatus Brocadiaceae bacterium]|nr:amidohydrolase family protein [Candidatus Brocadiaceae bacterium]
MLSVRGATVYTGKDVVYDAIINFDHTTIVDISNTKLGEMVGEFEVITPAFIDPHCHIGMRRAGEPSSEEETNEKMDAFTILAKALDSVQMDDSSFQDSVEAGVLYSCVLPGSGNILGGRSAVIRNYGKTTTEAFISQAPSSIKAAVGYNPMSTHEWKGTRPHTRMGSMALLREKLYAVKSKLGKKRTTEEEKEEKGVCLSREEEIIRDILYGKELLRVHVHKTDDIESVLRLVDEFHELNADFKISVTVDHACDVHEIDVFNTLRERGIAVVYGPMDSLAYKVELKHEGWRNIKYLLSSDVTYGLMTDHPVILQRMLLFQLRWFIRMGVTKHQAIRVITHNNANILGLGAILGTLEKNKWASFLCWNGDPFDMTRYPVTVYGEGKLLFQLL